MMYSRHLCKNAAFSLIEMAIVLAILALLAGGITAGGSLLHNAKLRDIASNAYRYSEAAQTFRDKYNAYPGDMVNATELWGRADTGAYGGNCANNVTSNAGNAITPTATCNGNGDGAIAHTAGQYYETLRAWQHLSNAGLIEGGFSGVGGGGGVSQIVAGVNAPQTFNQQAAYDMVYLQGINGASTKYIGNIDHSHVMHFGMNSSGNNPAHNAVISAADAAHIDVKHDDGMPGTGSIVTFDNTTQSSCVTSNIVTALYRRENDSAADCTLVFINSW